MSVQCQLEIATVGDAFERRWFGRSRWSVRTGWAQRLFDERGVRLPQWLEDGSAQVVKHGAQRIVYRVELADHTFYLKHYRSPSLIDWARNAVRPPASRREFSKALELDCRGIPTFCPLALGECYRCGVVGESYLITAAIPDAMSLLDFAAHELPRMEIDQQRLVRDQLAEALAALCVRLHRAGVFHDDFHAGNILVQTPSCQPDEHGRIEPRFYLVDLPGIEFSGPLDWPRSRDNLLMLHSDWSQRTTPEERWRFWRRYALLRSELRLPDPRAAGLEIFARARDYGCRVLAGRVKRALRVNRDFQALRGTSAHAHAVTPLPPHELAALVDDPERPFRQFWHEPVKLSPASLMVTAQLPLGGVSTAVAYKRIRPKSLTKRLGTLVRRNRALTAWLLGHALLERGIATARPVAAIVPHDPGRLGVGYVATEWIADALNLHLYLWQLADKPSHLRRSLVRQAAVALGGLIGRMHAWRVAHRDLKGCNVLLAERGERVEAYLIDLDGVRIRRQLGYAEQVRNLARIAASIEAHPWVSRADRWRFLRAYLEQLTPHSLDARQLYRDVASQARRIIARLQRQGKPVA